MNNLMAMAKQVGNIKNEDVKKRQVNFLLASLKQLLRVK